MDRNSRSHVSDDPLEPADGPLAQLVDSKAEQAEQTSVEDVIPGQPEAKPAGRDDYASGTSEHDDDREMP